MAKALLMSLGLLVAVAVEASVIDFDNSPVCRYNLPLCQASCTAPNEYLFVCSAGGGPKGGPSIKCNCVTPAAPTGGDQRATLTFHNYPGAQACKQKTWINDCARTLSATINGSAVNVTPPKSTAFNNITCDDGQGIVIGPNRAAVALPGYPLGLLTSSPDGTVNISFAAFDDNTQDCFAVYTITEGSFMNGPLPAAGGLYGQGGLPGQMTALGGTQAAGLGGLGAPSSAAIGLPPMLLLLLLAALGCLVLTHPA